jgi:predicted aldo/keto reductase-like oxidoreductase
MMYRSFPKIPDLKISTLGLGLMRLPLLEGDEARIDENRSDAMLMAAVDAGVNYVDTAWIYHKEQSEPYLGRAMERLFLRDRLLVATKSPSWLIKEAGDWDRFLNTQLERLRTDHIDFYLIHALNKKRWQTVLDTAGLDALVKAKADGRIKHIGFSFHDSLDSFKAIVDGWDGWEFCQVQYNYLDEEYQAGRAGIEYAADRGIGTVVMEPLRGGALARVPDEVKAIFAGYGKPRMATEWALRHVLDRQETVSVLSGMGSVDQIWENAAVASSARPNAITEAERRVIVSARDWFRQRMPVPCTTCGYCNPCPSGVLIPEIFELWNSAVMFDEAERRSAMYRTDMVGPGRDAGQCTECGLCVPKCPQGIDIPARLKEAAALLS